MEWSARPGTVAALAGSGIVLGASAVLLDPVGQVLVGAAALLLLVLAGRAALLRPRVSTSPAGVVVRGLGGRRELPWAALRVRVRDTRRWGLRSRLLELDTARGPDEAGDLVLLSRWELGADPGDVARALEAGRPA
ncbi:PH domain-containing protein [Trujillonella humicola]|uniref:PH domain-containing protein n=1 Tax=Trujillonella humicola TaxID=3383699 RepID=UPI003905CAA0